jgi:hypothetical protein
MEVHFSSKIPSIQMSPKLHIPPQLTLHQLLPDIKSFDVILTEMLSINLVGCGLLNPCTLWHHFDKSDFTVCRFTQLLQPLLKMS